MSHILARSLRVAGSLLLAAPWLACRQDESDPLDPSLSHTAAHTISGRLLDADGRNICRTIQEGTILVRLLNADFGRTSDVQFLGEQALTCPKNLYTLPADAGTAHLRVDLPNPNLGKLPRRNLDEVLVGPDAGVTHNVSIVNGAAVNGRARLDGQPFEGVLLDVTYEFNPAFGATRGSSGPDGRWMEFFGRSPMILEKERRYVVFSNCDAMLGTRQLAGLPDQGFLFPSQSTLNCTLETAASTQFSHTLTRLAVTPMPGEIGGWFGTELADRFGVGWGVQFPVARGSAPAHANPDFSDLFLGGLMIGIGPDKVLAGVDVGVAMECGATCHDLGLDGTVEFAPQGERTRTRWRYSDATSAEAVGLNITQESIDGKGPNDYVLFRFMIRNTSPSALTFHAGFVGDWDVELDAGDDVGATALSGKLMYQVSDGEKGIHVGTMMLGDAPVSGNYFFSAEDNLSVVEQVRALNGGLRQRTAGPGDLRNIHGVGPITLARQQTKDVWFAIVAGESRAQLLANAEAARADVANRLSQAITADPSMITVDPAPVRGAKRTVSRPVRKDSQPRY
jgi:hypothetical protein